MKTHTLTTKQSAKITADHEELITRLATDSIGLINEIATQASVCGLDDTELTEAITRAEDHAREMYNKAMANISRVEKMVASR